MVETRHHVHVICSPDNQVSILDQLTIFMEKKAFLTKDLLQGDAEATNYSRRCVDCCDYIFMLIGDSYGKLSQTGVSQIHLSYIYAKTKAKPMIILRNLNHTNTTSDRQLTDFIKVVEKQSSESIYYYDEDIYIQEFLEPLYRKLVREKKRSGWKKLPEKNSRMAISTTTKKQPAKISSLNTIRSLNQKIFNKNKSLKSKSTNSASKSTKQNEVINNDISVRFSTDAYEGGNLTNMRLAITLNWVQILQLISKKPTSVAVFKYALTEIVHDEALPIVQKECSNNVHAVSRTQIDSYEIESILEKIVNFGWVPPLKKIERTALSKSALKNVDQRLLTLTTLGQKKLQAG